jgi:hypothetical protein
MFRLTLPESVKSISFCNDQLNAQVFKFYFIYLFNSALHVSSFLLAHLQRQVYNFGSGSSLLGMVSAPGDLNHCRSCTPACEDGLKESPKHVMQK